MIISEKNDSTLFEYNTLAGSPFANRFRDCRKWYRLQMSTRTRAMKYERIVVDPRIMFGKPVIKGTRIPVDLILRALQEGMTIEELLDGYPRLTREDILDAQAFGADYFTLESEDAAPG
jgi:uncharacterized protein (DUF433 family)